MKFFYRTFLKVAFGFVSAMTIFSANYYEEQSSQRKLSNHKKMEHFYDKVYSLLDKKIKKKKDGKIEQIDMKIIRPEEVLKVLAVEELIKKGSWCSYQRDNTQDINL